MGLGRALESKATMSQARSAHHKGAWVSSAGPQGGEAGSVPSPLGSPCPSLTPGSGAHITRQSIATDWHFTAALRCCQGL